jgi:hypothetical protein
MLYNDRAIKCALQPLCPAVHMEVALSKLATDVLGQHICFIMESDAVHIEFSSATESCNLCINPLRFSDPSCVFNFNRFCSCCMNFPFYLPYFILRSSLNPAEKNNFSFYFVSLYFRCTAALLKLCVATH